MIITLAFPEKAKLLIKAGQSLEIGASLYEESAQKEIKIQIAQKLHIAPHTIFKHLKKFVGDEISKDELLAEKKSLFSTASCRSEFTGVIKEINHAEGVALLSIRTEDDIHYLSPLQGTVEELTKKEIKIKISKAKEYDTKEIAGRMGGRSVYVQNEHDIISEEMVNGAIIIAEKLTSYSQMKHEALGAVGFVLNRHLVEIASTPHAVVKTVQDFEAIQKNKSPYCFIDNVSGKIVFYG
ncbi:hypothetical protein COY90_04095 [Candidatus Roizmanbacteria bacterium CG_4_10_14_0_8_um_filter_39_9]|uniref:Uncharacterized protein n=1 Tax=Candidatus Roizmanbacteria bacterium CG_4_10_14_0_8_um_filter_39_9 TaxID=1974829 RepID=A0A2M7QD37_9BACT|nr:MAG: hypothetical protein COY90_04095 [Candidatus Roizmanbacteria bacterium CG_4_10_14_0_8_um_filter_39_9]